MEVQIKVGSESDIGFATPNASRRVEGRPIDDIRPDLERAVIRLLNGNAEFTALSSQH